MGFSYSLLPRAEQGAAGNQAALTPSHPLLPSHHPKPPLKLHLGDSIETNKNFFTVWSRRKLFFFPLKVHLLHFFFPWNKAYWEHSPSFLLPCGCTPCEFPLLKMTVQKGKKETCWVTFFFFFLKALLCRGAGKKCRENMRIWCCLQTHANLKWRYECP